MTARGDTYHVGALLTVEHMVLRELAEGSALKEHLMAHLNRPKRSVERALVLLREAGDIESVTLKPSGALRWSITDTGRKTLARVTRGQRVA
jgi:hypothetical protein